MNNQFLATSLQGLGQGLMAAGGGGWSQFAPGLSQGLMQAQNSQLERLDREERRRLRELQEQQLQMQVEAQRTENQDAVKEKQDWNALFQPGIMSPPTGASVGGMRTPGMQPGTGGSAPPLIQGLMQGADPAQIEILKRLGPQAGKAILAERAFADPSGAPETTGGMYWDQAAGQFKPIPGYQEQQAAIRAAGKSVTNVQNNMGSTGIDYGDPEAGLAWVRNTDGSVKLDARGLPMAAPYQGSKAFVAATDAAATAENAAATEQQTADIVTQDIDRILELVDSATLPTTGMIGGALANVGGTAARDVRALVDTVGANIGFDKLQQMRAASPTGGALGSITERELALLQATLGNLEQSQTEGQFKDNLTRLKEIYLDVIHGPGNRPQAGKKRLKYNSETGELE